MEKEVDTRRHLPPRRPAAGAEYESDRDAGIPIVDRNTSFTLREFFSQWLDSSIKPPSRSLGTYENYIYCADKFARTSGMCGLTVSPHCT